MSAAVKDRLSNHVFDVVRDAIWSGISPEEFKVMVVECWRNALDDEAKRVTSVFAERRPTR